ncbi:MAG: hypothetical protein KAI79_14810 [Bacteroidales bacterium]|nr:hypothetical protein [Bacteroidales bacterium]
MSKKKRKGITAKNKKQKSQVSKSKIKVKNKRTSSKIIPFLKKIGGGLLFVISILGLLSLFTIWPRISISTSTALDPHNPFKTPFIVKNDGYLSLYNIKYSLTAELLEMTNGTILNNCGSASNGIIERLRPNSGSTLFVDKIFSVSNDKVKTAKILVNITYKPISFISFTFTQQNRFIIKKNANDEYIWFESYEKK